LQRLDAFLGEGEGFQLLTHHPWYFLQLVKGHMAFGHRERARALLGRLLAHGEGARDGWLGAELTALEACLASDHDAQRACAGYQQAIRIARGQGAALIELGAAVGLLRCARGGIGRRDAKALVHDAFSRMSEQLGEAGDGEARSLLRQQFRRVISL
jgi:hypothetical protein